MARTHAKQAKSRRAWNAERKTKNRSGVYNNISHAPTLGIRKSMTKGRKRLKLF